MKSKDRMQLLVEKLAGLRLPAMADALANIVATAAAENLSVLDVVDRLADEEMRHRLARAVKSRIVAAKFPEINTVDGFDFDYDLTRKKIRARYLALHDMAFLDKGINPLFLGRPGTGKTYLARALAYAACQARRRVVVISAPKMLNQLQGAEIHGMLEKVSRPYLKADLLVIDDFAVLEMDPSQAKLAFQIISERYDYRRSTAITTNRPFRDWSKVFPDALNAQVIAERLTERSENFVLNGKGYGTRGGNTTTE